MEPVTPETETKPGMPCSSVGPLQVAAQERLTRAQVLCESNDPSMKDPGPEPKPRAAV
jgi:hypothetical protein